MEMLELDMDNWVVRSVGRRYGTVGSDGKVPGRCICIEGWLMCGPMGPERSRWFRPGALAEKGLADRGGTDRLLFEDTAGGCGAAGASLIPCWLPKMLGCEVLAYIDVGR